MKTILIFGVFDGVHDGHRFLFHEARRHGGDGGGATGVRLIAAIAPDEVVQKLKGRAPKHDLAARITALKREPLVDDAVAGDEQLSGYEIVKKLRPDIIVVGYDQRELKKDLEARRGDFDWDIKIIVAAPHRPEELHNSLMK